MSLLKLNYATLGQGLLAGLINTYVLFEVNSSSLTMASLWIAIYVLGGISSGFVKGMNNKLLKIYSHFARILMIGGALFYSGEYKVLVLTLIGYLVAMGSRKQFIDLKHHVAKIDKNGLTAHGTWNAIGYGTGSLIVGVTFNDFKTLFIFTVSLTLIASFILYPTYGITDIDENKGLSKRDIYVAIIFTIGSTPISNLLGTLIFTNIFNEKFGGLTALAYTMGSITATTSKKVLINFWRPIGSSLLVASLLLLVNLLWSNQLFVIFSRLVSGSLLFAAQGLLEERAKSHGELGKGIDFLWKLFSTTAFISVLLLTFIGEKWGFITLSLLSIVCSLLIMSLKLIIK